MILVQRYLTYILYSTLFSNILKVYYLLEDLKGIASLLFTSEYQNIYF